MQKKQKFSLLTSILAVGFVLLCGCSEDTNTAGTVTDTGNTIADSDTAVAAVTGVVRREDGSIAAEATVRMARRATIKDGALQIPEHVETQTDSAGVFAFDSALADTFQLAVIDTSVAEIFYLPRTTPESIDSIRLEKAAIFSSVLYYENADSNLQVGSHFVVTLAGTPFYQSVFAGDSFGIMIPAGTGWMEFFPGDPQIIARLQDNGVADSLIYRSWELKDSVSAGDTVSQGPFIWSTSVEVDSLIKEEEEEAKIVTRISGSVVCKSGRACEGVEVMLITDLFGFEFTEGDSLEFVVNTVTDSLGRWWLPLPASVPDDSFRVEYRLMNDGFPVQTGVSRYVNAKEIKNLKDTLDLGVDSLAKPASIRNGVNLVINRQDTTQSSNCMVNSVVVGIKGTSHFVRDVTCYDFPLSDLPKGHQEVILYSGDTKVMSKLRESEIPMDYYVTGIPVTLPEGNVQEVQWLTYTPPDQSIFSEKK